MQIPHSALPLGPASHETAMLRAFLVVALTCLVPSPVDAQPKGLFSSVHDAAQQWRSPALLDGPPIRLRMVSMDLERLRRAQVSTAAPPHTEARSKSLAPPFPRRAARPATGTALYLNLFDDVVLTGIVDSTAPTLSGGFSLSGRLVEEPLGSVTLVVNGEVVAGTVRTLERTFQIRTMADGLYAISEVKPAPLECLVQETESE